MRKFGMSLFAGVVMLGAMACGDDGIADKVENRVQCRKICSQLDECDAKVDISDCTASCDDLTDDEKIETKVEDCSECLDVSNSCSENVEECATRCTGVVALTTLNN